MLIRLILPVEMLLSDDVEDELKIRFLVANQSKTIREIVIELDMIMCWCC